MEKIVFNDVLKVLLNAQSFIKSSRGATRQTINAKCKQTLNPLGGAA